MKVTVFSTKGSQKAVYETESTTWGQLKSELSRDYNFNNLQATENITRRDLTVDSAELPTSDFTLFLRPIKTKSGAYSYAEAKSIIKNDTSLQEAIKKKYGKNYTNLPTNILNEAITLFGKEMSSPAKPETAKVTEVKSEKKRDVFSCVEKKSAPVIQDEESIEDITEMVEDFLASKGYTGITVELSFTGVEDVVDDERAALEAEAIEIFG